MLVPVFVLAVMSTTLEAPNTATKLYTDCKQHVAFANGENPRPSGDVLFNAGFCLGYVTGLTDALVSKRLVCVSDGNTTTFVRVYIAYMDKNPKLFDQPINAGVEDAITEAYPCPAK
jgi:hypothetical protein